jgi:hypothetical protein
MRFKCSKPAGHARLRAAIAERFLTRRDEYDAYAPAFAAPPAVIAVRL